MTGPSHKKDGGDNPPDLLDRQADFFEEYFRKGAEFTRALITENLELKRRLSEVEEQFREASGVATLNREQSESEQRQIEREHYDLACLFVAQGQLARARDAGESLRVIAEVLLNFVGAHKFAIYAADSSGTLRPLFAAEIDLADLPPEAPERLDEAFARDRTIGSEVGVAELSEDPVVAFPLRFADKPFGAVAVWSFLAQKSELARVDSRLFEVIADAGGSALESSRIRGQVPRIAGKPDHYSGLALLLGLGGRNG